MPKHRRRESKRSVFSDSDDSDEKGQKKRSKKAVAVVVPDDEDDNWNFEERSSSAPETFDGCMKWLVDTATRDSIVQLIGALNLPYSPWTLTSSDHQVSKWLEENRALLSKRQQTFVSAVRSTFERNRQDQLRISKTKETKVDEKRRSRERYSQMMADDCQLMMSKSDSLGDMFIFALLEPVTSYSISYWRKGGAEPSFGAPDDSIPNKVVKERKRVIDACKPVLCRIEMSKAPSGSEGMVRGNCSYHSPSTAAVASLSMRTTIQFLGLPVGSHRTTDFASFNKDVKNLETLDLPPGIEFPLNAPSWNYYNWNQNRTTPPTPWYSYLVRKLPPNTTTPTNALLNNDDDGDDRDEDIDVKVGQFVGKKDTYAKGKQTRYIAKLKMLTEETRRFRKLALMHPEFLHVTSVPAIWHIVLEFQISP